MCYTLPLSLSFSLSLRLSVSILWFIENGKINAPCHALSDSIVMELQQERFTKMFMSHLPTKWYVHINSSPPIVSVAFEIFWLRHIEMPSKKWKRSQPNRARRKQKRIQNWIVNKTDILTYLYTLKLWKEMALVLRVQYGIAILQLSAKRRNTRMWKEWMNERTNEHV